MLEIIHWMRYECWFVWRL